MSVVLMDGKKVAEEFLQTQHFTDNTLRPPLLCIITVGEDKASQIYVKNKLKKCKECGINIIHNTYPNTVTYSTLQSYINELNYSPNVDRDYNTTTFTKTFKGNRTINITG